MRLMRLHLTDTIRSIGILICPLNRPTMSDRCLESVLALRIPDGRRIEVCAVENDLEGKSRIRLARSTAILRALTLSTTKCYNTIDGH